MLTGIEFLAYMKHREETLARGECPEDHVRCVRCNTPTYINHILDEKCGSCHNDLYWEQFGNIIEEFPIFPPRLRR